MCGQFPLCDKGDNYTIRLSQELCNYNLIELYTGSTQCFIKKEPPLFGRRKETSRCKIVKLGSFSGF